MLWDIFCRVIDNFGDIGVTWRLSADLARRGETVRLWVDDARALRWMAPGALEGQWPGVAVLPWTMAQNPLVLAELPPAEVWIEAFGCDVPADFLDFFFTMAIQNTTGDGLQPVWINLEYLSAEPYVERSHLLKSPVMSGPAKGWEKTFFYPGFTAGTGGLIRTPVVPEPSLSLKAEDAARWLTAHDVVWNGERLVSLFCYEPSQLETLLNQLADDANATVLLITAGRASAAVRALSGGVDRTGNLRLHYLPQLSQREFDSMLQICDLNFVRGEDSLVRAIWAGKPFVWHIYPQEDEAHLAKLDAFLNTLDAPESMRTSHHLWNSAHDPITAQESGRVVPLSNLPDWEDAVTRLRNKLMQMDDLTGQLVQFAGKSR